MLAFYRSLLHLYPSAYRDEYGDEMLAVLDEVQVEFATKDSLARAICCAREVTGLLSGALQEHLRHMTGSYGSSMFSSRRCTMRSEFRFPKLTVTLMAIILATVFLAIDQARSIQASIPFDHPYVGPIEPLQFTLVPTLLILFVGAGVAGAIGWAIVFALHRSGVHRLSEVNPFSAPRSGRK